MTPERAVITTSRAPAPAGAYEQAIADGGFLFTSGIVGRDPAGDTVPAEFRSEVRQALANLDAILGEGGMTRRDVIKTLCFLVDTDDFAAFDAEYAAYFGEAKPTRSTVGVSLAGGYRFEIEAVARHRLRQ